jgi:hypothetical protein
MIWARSAALKKGRTAFRPSRSGSLLIGKNFRKSLRLSAMPLALVAEHALNAPMIISREIPAFTLFMHFSPMASE